MNLRDEINTKLLGDYTHESANMLACLCNGLATEAGWWDDTNKQDINVKACKIALMHSELSECLEGIRKNSQDDHLPARKMEHVELADALIRIFDYCGAYDIPIGKIIVEKLRYNVTRKDHNKEARAAAGGKKI